MADEFDEGIFTDSDGENKPVKLIKTDKVKLKARQSCDDNSEISEPDDSSIY